MSWYSDAEALLEQGNRRSNDVDAAAILAAAQVCALLAVADELRRIADQVGWRYDGPR